LTTLTISGTAQGPDGSVATASVDVEVSEPAAAGAAPSQRLIAAEETARREPMAFRPALSGKQPASIAGFGPGSSVKEVVATPAPAPKVTQTIKSTIYQFFTGGYR
jgi:hypothetical protein